MTATRGIYSPSLSEYRIGVARFADQQIIASAMKRDLGAICDEMISMCDNALKFDPLNNKPEGMFSFPNVYDTHWQLERQRRA